LDYTDNIRDKAIIALFAESGLRISELVSIGPNGINWTLCIIRVIDKGKKEAHAPLVS
jgi:integrase/recombinase XerC